ncbi:hypothetical protein COX84_00740, partial [Candidatus Micrarchaeota archaeon CG_4_10_14_0_2_um_filter_49_7]
MVVVNVKLTGALEQVVEDYMSNGYATSKAEVIRVALRELGEKHKCEDISDDPELERYLADVKQGKIKLKYVGKNS